MIKTKDLHIGYSKPILDIEDLNLSSGVHILIGKNGSGKSTFLKTITGQLASVRGTIQLNGKDVSSISISEMPTMISFVGSQFPIVDFLRVSEFVILGRSPHTNFFDKKTPKDLEAMNDALQILGIEYLKDRFTSELSDGEKQLVSIAKALTQETPIITLDEPTAFLDYSNKKLVLENLISISKKFGKCILLSSHDIDLSLEAGCPFLVVDNKQKILRSIDSGISKADLIELAF